MGVFNYHNSRPRTERCPKNPSQNLIRFLKFPFRLLFRLLDRDRPKESPIRIDLFRWLNYTDHFSSTLPRDRVFAFLNAAFVTDKKNIWVDYSSLKTDRRIFSEVTAYLARSRSPTQYLLPLKLQEVGKMQDLPSWVPDWTIPSYHDQIITGLKDYLHCAGQNDAIWQKLFPNTEPLAFDIQDRPVQFSFSTDFQSLFIRGAVIDNISFAVLTADGDNLARSPDFRKPGKLWYVAQKGIFEACRAWEDKAFASQKPLMVLRPVSQTPSGAL